MPTLAKNNDRQLETGLGTVQTSAPYSQPWWHAFGNNSMHASGQQNDGLVSSASLQSQGNGEGTTKETETEAASQPGLNGNVNVKEQQHLDANSQMELVSHSIMLTSYPYSDPQYGGIMTYGAPLHNHLLGYHPARMPLPLEMEEEPVYVNAKQYHGILRRRQLRAKAEMERKLIKNRKPYLHESRHQHAMRRARGTGGRFLNTKKLDANAKNAACSSAAHLSSDDGNRISQQREDTASRIQEQAPANGHGHGLSLYYTQSTGAEQQNGHFGEENWNLLVNRAPHGPSPRK